MSFKEVPAAKYQQQKEEDNSPPMPRCNKGYSTPQWPEVTPQQDVNKQKKTQIIYGETEDPHVWFGKDLDDMANKVDYILLTNDMKKVTLGKTVHPADKFEPHFNDMTKKDDSLLNDVKGISLLNSDVKGTAEKYESPIN